METPSAILSALRDVLRIPVAELGDIACQNSVLVTYEGYRIDIRGIRLLKGKGVAVHVQFMAKQKWWHIFKDPTGRIVRDLQNICANELRDLHFSRFEITLPDEPLLPSDGCTHFVFYHDSRAFNGKWKEGRDISPLLISPDAHHGNCFVEFEFNPGGYRRSGETTVLRDDWATSAFDVSEAIECDANRLFPGLWKVGS
jgi:hypothetical protein